MPKFTVLALLFVAIVTANKFLTSFYEITNSVRCSDIDSNDVASGYCIWSSKFISGDFNGDGFCDTICFNAEGIVNLKYGIGDGSFRFSHDLNSYSKISTSFCDKQDTYFVAVDFDKDGYDDIVCVFDDIPNDGEVRVHVIKGKATDFSLNTPELLSNVSASSDVFDDYGSTTGNFDGDGFCDIACHGFSAGSWRLSVMFFVADIRRLWMGPGSDRYGEIDNKWCNTNVATVSTTDVTGDGVTDMLCHYDVGNTVKVYVKPGNKERIVRDHPGGGNFLVIMKSDIVSTSCGIDPVVPCAASLQVAENDISKMNPCENVTRNAAYLQSDVFSVGDDYIGAFCLDPAKSSFMSADIDGNGWCDMICLDNLASPDTSVYIQYLKNDGRTYETRHNLPNGTLGLGKNFICPGKLHSIDFDGDKRWDLFCSDDIPLQCGQQNHFRYWLSSADGSGIKPEQNAYNTILSDDIILGPICSVRCPLINQRGIVVTYSAKQHVNSVATIGCSDKFKTLRGTSPSICQHSSLWDGGRWQCENQMETARRTWTVYEHKCNPERPRQSFYASDAGVCLKYCESLTFCWVACYDHTKKRCNLSTGRCLNIINNISDDPSCTTYVMNYV